MIGHNNASLRLAEDMRLVFRVYILIAIPSARDGDYCEINLATRIMNMIGFSYIHIVPTNLRL